MSFKRTAFVLFLTLGLFTHSQGQTYTIPWAQQQPAWVFPVWFQCGDGQRDTLYIGYDSAGHDYVIQSQNPDTVFGEKCVLYDPAHFFVRSEDFLDCSSTMMIRADIRQFQDSSFYCAIDLIHFRYPIKISWDLSLFHSSALPFHTCSTCPKAIGAIGDDFAYSMPEMSCLPQLGNAIYFTDSTTELCGVVRDSIVFDSVLFNSIGIHGIMIKKWRADSLFTDGIKASEPSFSIFPIPCSDILNINGTVLLRQLSIIDCLGRARKSEILTGARQAQIDVEDLPPGFYILRLDTDHNTISKLIIKN